MQQLLLAPCLLFAASVPGADASPRRRQQDGAVVIDLVAVVIDLVASSELTSLTEEEGYEDTILIFQPGRTYARSVPARSRAIRRRADATK